MLAEALSKPLAPRERRHEALLVAIFILIYALGDLATTYYIIETRGISDEINPLGKLGDLAFPAMILLKSGAVIVGIFGEAMIRQFEPRAADGLLVFLIVFGALIVANNLAYIAGISPPI